MICLACNKELSPSATRKKIGAKKYCNVSCQHLFQSLLNRDAFLRGDFNNKLIGYPTNSWTRNLLIEKFGARCNCCGLSEWNSKPLTLEVNHKDGNAANNVLENLEFLCPNCHSQTDTFKAKNKESARTYRRKPV